MGLLKGEGKADVCAQLEQASLLFRIVQAAVAWYLLISGIVQTLGLAVFIRPEQVHQDLNETLSIFVVLFNCLLWLYLSCVCLGKAIVSLDQ